MQLKSDYQLAFSTVLARVSRFWGGTRIVIGSSRLTVGSIAHTQLDRLDSM